MLSCMSCLYILDINSLSVISFANIFSHSVSWHFRFVDVQQNLALQKLLCFVVVQSLSRVWLYVTSWTASRQASLSLTVSWSQLKLMFIESMMPCSHLILCHSLLLLPSIFPSVRVFSKVSSSHQVAKLLELQLQYQSFQWILRTDFL